MKLTRTTRNVALAAVLTSGLAFAGTAAIAQSPADTTAPVKKPGYRQVDPQMVEKHNAFLASTVELRKQMAEKQAEFGRDPGGAPDHRATLSYWSPPTGAICLKSLANP